MERTNQSRACYGAGQSGTPARLWKEAEGPRQRPTRAARAASSLLLAANSPRVPRSTMDAPRKVVNFGPGPAKLPRSVSPSDRARKAQSEREHACEWRSIILRGELCICLLVGRWDPLSRSEPRGRSAPACTRFRILRTWKNTLAGEGAREACPCSCSEACTVCPAGALLARRGAHLGTPAASGPAWARRRREASCPALASRGGAASPAVRSECMHGRRVNEWRTGIAKPEDRAWLPINSCLG